MTKQEVDQAIIEALGLSGQIVESLRISLHPSHFPRVEAVFIVPPERLGDLGYRLKSFDLVPREEVYGE